MEPWIHRRAAAPERQAVDLLVRADLAHPLTLHGELRARSRPAPTSRPAVGARLVRGLPLAAIVLLAGALRLWAFDRVGGNAFYDAAVRSMSRSWHNFFFGAYDPAGMTAVDKAPVDLWLQVASAKLLGYGTVALRLPEALGGIAAVGLLYGLGRRLFGRAAGLAAAAALAVLPASVLTARSDTMDSLMCALVVLAAWLIVRAAQAPAAARTRWIAAAGAALGVAFNVKLAEALIPLPALALLAWLALRGAPGRRARPLLAGALVFVGVALSWLVAVALAPGPKPFPIGSQDGTAWNVVLVFDGLARLGLAPSGAPAPSAAGGGPFVLLGLSGAHLGALFGGELLSALLAGGAALALARREEMPRLASAGVACIVTWLLSGIAALSVTAGLRTRYLEALAPAVALALGAGVVALARVATASARRRRTLALAVLVATIALAAAYAVPAARPAPLVLGIAGLAALAGVGLRKRAPRTLAAIGLVGVLAIPTGTAARLATTHVSDAGNPGGMPLRQLAHLDRYLTAHRARARYELAVAAAAKAGPLIARNGQPVLVLTSAYGIPLVSADQLADDVETGRVRYFLAGGAPCRPRARHATGCAPAVRWARAHGTDVSARAGAPHHGILLRLRAHDTATRRPLAASLTTSTA